MKIQYLGQNCFLFTHNGKNILSDPFYNHGKADSGFNIASQTIDYILITHAHGDHTDDVKEVLEHHPAVQIMGQPEICGYFQHPHSIDLNLGGSAKVGDMKVTMVPASHTSSFPDGTYGGVACGYMFHLSGRNIYFAGDTGVMADMELFPRLFGEITLAILPVGSHYTMDAAQASFAASELLKTNKVIGCHFDTFAPIRIDHAEARKHFEHKGVELMLPKLGEIVDI